MIAGGPWDHWAEAPRRGGMLRAWLAALVLIPTAALAQVAAPADPQPLVFQEDFETDADADGEPDGWYNRRDAAVVEEAQAGLRSLRFQNERPGRPARISRAFPLDGRAVEALVVELWVKAEKTLPGERLGETAGLMIDMLGEDVRSVGRRSLGPWHAKELGQGWVHVARRLPVPPTARDGILTVGLLGATGTLWIDGLTVRGVPREETPTTALLLNGDFELGDPQPAHWTLEGKTRRVCPGRDSAAALELSDAGDRALTGVGVRVRGLPRLSLRLNARANGLRASGGGAVEVFFLDAEGRNLPGGGVRPLVFTGSFDWRGFAAVVNVPRGADRAVLQIEKSAHGGALEVDDIQVESSPDPGLAAWVPFHEGDDATRWPAYVPAPSIVHRSALDASALLEGPAGDRGRVVVRQGHLEFEKGGRARFFGVALLPPTAFLPPERADQLAEDLSRRGVNLVRLTALDAPLGPGVSLLDDARDDTRALDPAALSRLDHLIAALKKQGIYVALELLGQRRFRSGDQVLRHRELPPGGGPAAAMDPAIRQRAEETGLALLEHVNPETGMPLRDDPALAWVTLAGELSLFDLIDQPDSLDDGRLATLKEQARTSSSSSGRRAWQGIEARQWGDEAKLLRSHGLKAPIAGSSHWRREPEFIAAQTAAGLDLIDDRLYWSPPRWGPAAMRSLAWEPADLAAPAAKKRRTDRPYVVGEWAAHTQGAWALPFEAADLLAVTRIALAGDWDAWVRRGVYLFPALWGASAPGTGGGPDAFPLPEALNANPSYFAMMPHAASVALRPDEARHARLPSGRGRVVLETAHTVAVASWSADRLASADGIGIELPGGFAAVAVSSLGAEPISKSNRLLVTVVGRAQPTGLTWADTSRREVADPGRAPIRLEPVRAVVTWKRREKVAAYALDGSGVRVRLLPTRRDGETARVALETGDEGTLHWELVAE